MAYNPVTDFLALIRNASGGASLMEIPGLDYVLAAMARAGFFRLWTGQAAPTVNQNITVWLKPSVPSWVAEGTVYLYDADIGTYVPATPELWNIMLANGYVFQSVGGAAATIEQNTTLLAIERDNPVATALTLPSIANREGVALRIVDWSTNVAAHTITLTPASGATIMRRATWFVFSTADQLGGVTLYPSSDLNGWVIS